MSDASQDPPDDVDDLSDEALDAQFEEAMTREPKIVRMPSDQTKALLDALEAGWRIESDPNKIHARYTDYDLAEAVPRVIMYLDLGALVGRIHALEAFLIEKGYQLAEVK